MRNLENTEQRRKRLDAVEQDYKKAIGKLVEEENAQSEPKRLRRSSEEIDEILRYAGESGIYKAMKKYGVTKQNLYTWRYLRNKKALNPAKPKIKKRKSYGEAFKRRVLANAEKTSVKSAAETFGITTVLIYQWRKKIAPSISPSPSNQNSDLEKRVQALESLVGKLLVEIESLKV